MPPPTIHAVARGDTMAANSDHPAPWWSIGKTVLAAAALRLADQGRLDLDAALQGRPYSLGQLLQHTAGVTTYGGASYQSAVAQRHPPWPREDLLARVGADRLLFAPGTAFSYSNIGALFVREEIEAVAGAPLDEALRTLVFEPLGLASPRLAVHPDDLRDTAFGNPSNYHPGWVYHGLLVGTPTDAVRLLRGLATASFLSRTSRDALFARRPIGGEIAGRPWTSTGYGLGLMMGTMKGVGDVFGHSGVGEDSVSALYHFAGLPTAPTVAVFATGKDEGVAEWEALRLALAPAGV